MFVGIFFSSFLSPKSTNLLFMLSDVALFIYLFIVMLLGGEWNENQ